MTLLHSQPWELRLLAWAEEAFNSHIHGNLIKEDTQTLDEAYRYCARITRNHSRTFFMASALLPPEKRRAARALYAFCRITDDIVDRSKEHNRLARLEQWRAEILDTSPNPHSPVRLAWADTQARFRIPHGYALQLIDGVARDLNHEDYQNFDELAEYAYGVASTVGLMVMHIMGFSGPDALPYAIRLGVALQITNILRDIGEDWRNGRLYLPLDELSAFGLSKTDIALGRVDERWRNFMRFQIARNRQLYAEAQPGIHLLDKDGRFAIMAAANLYEAILRDIETHDYDVFHRRARTTTLGKLKRLPSIWWRSRHNRFTHHTQHPL